MIETLVGNRIVVPAQLCALARGAPVTPTLHQIGDDIWTTYEPVARHVDNTADDFVAYGLIIINDPEVALIHGGRVYAIPPGTLYRIDGRVEHATQGACGLFAALVWDMPPTWDLADFAAELARDTRFK